MINLPDLSFTEFVLDLVPSICFLRFFLSLISFHDLLLVLDFRLSSVNPKISFTVLLNAASIP